MPSRPKIPEPPPLARPRAPHVEAAIASVAQARRAAHPAAESRPLAIHVQRAIAPPPQSRSSVGATQPRTPQPPRSPAGPAFRAPSVQRLPVPGRPQVSLPAPHVREAFAAAREHPQPGPRVQVVQGRAARPAPPEIPALPRRAVAPPVHPIILRSNAIQRASEAKEYYYTTTKTEFKNEIDLIGGNVTRLTPKPYEKKTPDLEEGAILHLQHHGQYVGKNRAANTIVLSTGAVNPEDFAQQLTLPKDRVFTLDIISCFTAGTKEEWDAKYHPTNIGRTFSYRLAAALKALGYQDGVVVRGYVGQSKLLSGQPSLVVGAGAKVGEERTDASEEGWYVDFVVGNPVGVQLGPQLQ